MVHFSIAQLGSHRVKPIRMVVRNNIYMKAYRIIPTLIKHNKEQQVKLIKGESEGARLD